MEDILTKLHDTQVEILRVIDRICKEYGLRYSLYAGSLLGAVRHQGFIPWDDDLDICMPREDYDRFIAIWKEVEHAGYILQNKESEPNFPQAFTKIRKDHTTFLQSQREAGSYHTGIFVDVFPVDRLPGSKLEQMLYYWNCMHYLLLTREFVPPKAGKLTQLVSSILLRLTPTEKRPAKRKHLLQALTKYNHNSSLSAVTTETIGAVKQHHNPEMLDNYTLLPFHGEAFSCFAGWDDHLRTKYGNYMQLPPEEERVWKHHPIIIDFEHNYEELNLQK